MEGSPLDKNQPGQRPRPLNEVSYYKATVRPRPRNCWGGKDDDSVDGLGLVMRRRRPGQMKLVIEPGLALGRVSTLTSRKTAGSPDGGGRAPGAIEKTARAGVAEEDESHTRTRSCSLNHKKWVFFSAGTNVGSMLQVTDPQTGAVKKYTNTKGTAAIPVQDPGALSCP